MSVSPYRLAAVKAEPSHQQELSDACKDKNDQEGALEIVVRSRKPKAVELTKSLKGVEKEDRLAAQQEQHLDQRATQLDLNLHRLPQQRKITAQPVHFLAKFKRLPPDMQSQLCGEIISENYKHNPFSDPGDPQFK